MTSETEEVALTLGPRSPSGAGGPRSRATLAALGAEGAREGGMLPAGPTGEGPAPPVRRPGGPGEGTRGARGGGTAPTRGDGGREGALATGLRTWLAGPGHLGRWHRPPGRESQAVAAAIPVRWHLPRGR